MVDRDEPAGADARGFVHADEDALRDRGLADRQPRRALQVLERRRLLFRDLEPVKHRRQRLEARGRHQRRRKRDEGFPRRRIRERQFLALRHLGPVGHRARDGVLGFVRRHVDVQVDETDLRRAEDARLREVLREPRIDHPPQRRTRAPRFVVDVPPLLRDRHSPLVELHGVQDVIGVRVRGLQRPRDHGLGVRFVQRRVRGGRTRLQWLIDDDGLVLRDGRGRGERADERGRKTRLAIHVHTPPSGIERLLQDRR